MTKVISLFGGSGLGKSTLAAGLYAAMKAKGIHCELVREYVKQWAWEGTKIGPYDQPYIFGKQSRAEARLYGKVDYIIPDSPLLLSPVYETFYTGKSLVLTTVLNFLGLTKDTGVEHKNFVLARHKPFDTRGRYETAEQATKVDAHVYKCLDEWGIPYQEVNVRDADRIEFILNEVLK